MTSPSTGIRGLYRRLPPSTTTVLWIIAAIAFANVFFLSGLTQDNPITWSANISHYLCTISCGRPAIDPNVGFITQPLGHLAATSLLHGHLPWWNYFEGIGAPLAGEMQAAALFPLTLLFAMGSGLLWFHISLEIIAGLSTFFLVKRLGLPNALSGGAGVLFALNGTFAWLGNAVLNPVAFLPMLLLGIEIIIDTTHAKYRRGWFVAALALALSLYAGFPEVAYVDGILAGIWAVVRVFTLSNELRLRGARRLGIAGGLGAALALPILTPFYDYMKVAFVGSHVAAIDGVAHLPTQAATMLVDPYAYGTIFYNPAVYNVWGQIGGYFGTGVAAMAILGLFGRPLRSLRLVLAGWSAAALLGAFNILGFRSIWNLIPLVKTMAFARYILPSVELSLIILAVLGIWDFIEERTGRNVFALVTAVALGAVIWSTLKAGHLNNGLVMTGKAKVVFTLLGLVPFVVIGLLIIFGQFPWAKVAKQLLILVLVAEALIYFWVPTAESPKQITLDMAPINFLVANQGESRTLDFGVLNPNWGTQFGVNEISMVDLPFPKAFANYIGSTLEPGLTPLNQFTVHSGITGIVQQERAVALNLPAYDRAGVKYLLIPNKVALDPALRATGLKQVFEDAIATIYQLPGTRPFYSTTNPCKIVSTDVASASLTCAKATTLIRSELMMSGWSATVNGKSAPLSTQEGVYQSVVVPAGTSTVSFSFTPPHESLAELVAALAILFLLATWLVDRRRRPAGDVEPEDIVATVNDEATPEEMAAAGGTFAARYGSRSKSASWSPGRRDEEPSQSETSSSATTTAAQSPTPEASTFSARFGSRTRGASWNAGRPQEPVTEEDIEQTGSAWANRYRTKRDDVNDATNADTDSSSASTDEDTTDETENPDNE